MTHVRTLARLLALALPAAWPAAARADHDVPFAGALTSTATSTSVIPDGLLRIEGTVAGRGIVLCKLTGSFTYEVNLADGSFAGTLTKVAANGDEVHETFTGQFNADFTASVGEFVIQGGTGRFQDATGAGRSAAR